MNKYRFRLSNIIENFDDVDDTICIKKIISGGQTGGDMGGLRAGKFLNIETGGTCPKGWKTEKGENKNLEKYGVVENDTTSYVIRTKQNVLDSHGTIGFGVTSSKGMTITKKYCDDNNKPYLHISYPKVNLLPNYMESKFILWLIDNKIEILNVAGNRESRNKGIEKYTMDFIVQSVLKYAVEKQ